MRPSQKAGGRCHPLRADPEIIQSSCLDLLQDFSDSGGELIRQRGSVKVVMLLEQLAYDYTFASHGAPQAVFQMGIMPGCQQMYPQRLGLGPIVLTKAEEVIALRLAAIS